MRVEIGDRCGPGSLGAGRLAAKVDFRLDLRKGKGDGMRVSVLGERINPRSAGVPETEEFGHFVVGLSGGIVHRTADQGVAPRAVRWTREIQMSMPAGDNQSECRFVRIEFV